MEAQLEAFSGRERNAWVHHELLLRVMGWWGARRWNPERSRI